MPFTPICDIQIYHEVRGTGPRLLHINGTGADLRRVPTIFDSPLAQHFEILAYDQRGLGQSSRPDIPYTMADYAEDAVALLDEIGWDRCMVLGVSFGGMVGQELAIRYPERIEKLVLACTSSGGAGGASYPLHELQGLSAEERAKKMISIADTRFDEAWQAEHPDELRMMIEIGLMNSAVGADEPGREIGAHRQIEARKEHNTYERLPNLQMPVYICGGRWDGIASPENLEALDHHIPNTQLEFFDGGHGFLMQDPKAYQQIISFLTEENTRGK